MDDLTENGRKDNTKGRPVRGEPQDGPSAIRWARRPRPDQVYPLLTVSEAMVKFRITDRRLYFLVGQGLVHPVQPHGRILYPEWEIEAALRAVSIGRLLFGGAIGAVA